MHSFLMILVLVSTPAELDLESWIGLALENAPAMQESQAALMHAEASFGTARAALLPRISLSASTGHTWVSSDPGGASAGGTSYSTGITLSQEILASGGSTWLSLRGADLGRDQADIQRDASIISLQQDVATKYYSAVEAAWLVRSAGSSLERSEVILERVELLFDLGEGTNIDLLSARVQETGDRLALMEREQQLSSALDQLRLAAGVSRDTSLTVDTTSVPEPLDLATATALRACPSANPSLTSAEISVERARLSLSSESRSWLPSLTTGGSWTWSGDRLDEEEMNSGGTWSVNVSLSMPLFDGWLTRSRVLSARASLLEAEAGLSSIGSETETAIEEARATLLTSIESIDLAELELEYAEQKMDLSMMSYQLGGMDLASLLEAQVGLSVAEAGLISARMSCLTAEVDFLALNGTSPRLGDWNE
jgi:outer membrane protein TolC